MASGDWGGGGAKLPGIVSRNKNIIKKDTITRAEAEPVPGEAPDLKYYSSPMYYKDPVDPEFVRVKAEGRKGYRPGR
jgi:hypothetical protein